jgi:hypothetical protein
MIAWTLEAEEIMKRDNERLAEGLNDYLARLNKVLGNLAYLTA